MTLLDALAIIAAYERLPVFLDAIQKQLVGEARDVVWSHAEAIRKEREK